jgi:hypothetical protein
MTNLSFSIGMCVEFGAEIESKVIITVLLVFGPPRMILELDRL